MLFGTGCREIQELSQVWDKLKGLEAHWLCEDLEEVLGVEGVGARSITGEHKRLTVVVKERPALSS